MGGVIAFETDTRWFVRNWAFDRFLGEVIEDHRSAPDIVHACNVAMANHGLHLALIREESGSLADRVFAAVEKTTRRVLAENERAFEGLGDDHEGRMLLLGQVARLSELLEHVREQQGEKPKSG